MPKDLEQMMTIGSKYRITSASGNNESIISTGEFRGYAAFSDETALCLKLDSSHGGSEGKMRFIPYHAIMLIDVLEFKAMEAVKESEESRVYYR